MPRDTDNPDQDRESPVSMVPLDAPDPVETRDPASHPIPRREGKTWLYGIVGLVIVLTGIVWLGLAERRRSGSESSTPTVTGTSGERRNDPEGLPRGDRPLNPEPAGPAVIADMELLSAKDQYVGRPVEIGAIPVTSVNGPRTFWVGRIGNRTLVLLDAHASTGGRLHEGEMVRLSGRVEKAPGENELARANLQKSDRDALDDAEYIIRANRVAPQQPEGPLQQPINPSGR